MVCGQKQFFFPLSFACYSLMKGGYSGEGKRRWKGNLVTGTWNGKRLGRHGPLLPMPDVGLVVSYLIPFNPPLFGGGLVA